MRPKEWIAFYDASGTESDPKRRPITVAGLLSTAHRWVRFDKDWSQVLGEFGVPYLHMKEFTSFNGAFAQGWKGDEAKRAAFLTELSKAVKRWVNKMWISYIPQTIFDEVDQHYSLREGTGGSYSLAAMLCSGMINDWLVAHHTGGDTVRHLFESGDAGQQQFVASAHRARVLPNIWPSQHPATGQWFGPFQAADFVAYEFATEFVRSGEPARPHPQRKSLHLLSRHIPYLAREATTEGLMGFCAHHTDLFPPRRSGPGG